MVEWTEDQREHVARQFNNVARGWWSKDGMGGEDGSPLWPECMKCHRLRTLFRADADGPPGSQPMWRCARCGAVMSQDDVRDYQTGLLLSVTETQCPQLVLTLLERCARMLFLASQGHAPTPEDAGDASRHAARVLDQFHMDEDWIHLTDQRESLLPDDPICSDAIGPPLA
jgi:hypothetical protein